MKMVLILCAEFGGSLLNASWPQSLYICKCFEVLNITIVMSMLVDITPGVLIQVVCVTSDIDENEELEFTYVEPFQSQVERQQSLFEKFGFWCNCPACSLCGKAKSESDTRRLKLSELDNKIKASNDIQYVIEGRHFSYSILSIYVCTTCHDRILKIL